MNHDLPISKTVSMTTTTTAKNYEFKFVYIYWESKQTVDQAKDSKCQLLYSQYNPSKTHPTK